MLIVIPSLPVIWMYENCGFLGLFKSGVAVYTMQFFVQLIAEKIMTSWDKLHSWNMYSGTPLYGGHPLYYGKLCLFRQKAHSFNQQ